MRIESHQEGTCRVVAIHGSADINASAALRQALLGAIEAGETHIVCDLSGTDFICSDALGVLITAYLKARGRRGFVRLANPQPRLKEILQTTRLNHLFEVFCTVQQATACE
jgi:anti-anti-sigma factor